MLTYTQLQTLYQALTNDTSTENQANGAVWMNQAYRQICAVRPWYWLEQSATSATVANQQFYDLPYDYDKLISVYQTVGSYKYVPRELVGQDDWNRLNQQQAYQSNYPVWYHIFNGQVGFWPTPSTTGQSITFQYRRNVVDLSIDNYATGTVATAGTTAIVGTGTSWNSSMVGKYLVVTPSATAATAGDGYAYKIASVTDTTHLTLAIAYAGANVTGASYSIGQAPAIPEAFQDMIAYKAAQQYYLTRNPDPQRVQNFKMMYDEKWDGLVQDSKKTVNPWVRPGVPFGPENPNNFWSVAIP